MTVRYGLIGAGMMGQEHIRNLALIEGASVVAIADPSEAMRNSSSELISREFGAAPTDFDDHKSLLSAGGIDALVIASPNHTHHAILADCLASPLPILCEKPVTIDTETAFAVAREVAERAAPFWVAMEYRYMPPIAEMIRRIDAGALGRLVRLSIQEHRFPFLDKTEHWNRFAENSGGTMVEKCCHFFDLMRLVTKSEPTRLVASGGLDVNYRDESYDGRRPDVLDNAYVIVDFANGTRAALDLCMFAEGSYFQEIVTAIGDAGKIDARIPGPARFWPGHVERNAYIEMSPRSPKQPMKEPVGVDQEILRAGDHHGSSYFQHELFFKLVKEGGTPEVTAHDGAMAVAMGAAAEKAIKTGEVIHF